MNILLTGACGLLGRAILRVAGEAHRFVPLDVCADVELLPRGVRASVLDVDSIHRAADGCDAIIHTAALHGAFRDKADNQDFIRTNLIGAENLFQAASRHGIKRLVFSSTLEVLCGGEWDASGRVVLDQDSPPRPDWIYPLTKLLVEHLGHLHARAGHVEMIQLRYAWLLNAQESRNGLHLLARGVSAEDAAEANLLAVTRPGLRDHVLLIGPDVPFVQADIESAHQDPWAVLERYWPGSGEYLRRHRLAVKPQHFWPVCRIDQARLILGWQPKLTFEGFLRSLGWRATSDEHPRRAPAEVTP